MIWFNKIKRFIKWHLGHELIEYKPVTVVIRPAVILSERYIVPDPPARLINHLRLSEIPVARYSNIDGGTTAEFEIGYNDDSFDKWEDILRDMGVTKYEIVKHIQDPVFQDKVKIVKRSKYKKASS